MAAYVPNRGDLIWISFSPNSGHEQGGKRPAIVLSPASYNGKVGLAIVCPITNQQKGYPFEVPLDGSSAITGVVLADQVKSFDWRARQAEKAGRAPRAVVKAVIQNVGVLLTDS